MRVASSIEIVARRPRSCGSTSPTPRAYLHFMSGVTRWEVVGDQRDRPRRALPDAAAGRLGRGRRADRGRRVRRATRDLAWTSVTGVDQRGRWRLRARRATAARASSCGSTTASPAPGIWGWLAERVAAPTVRGHLRRTLQQLKRQVEHEQLRAAAAERRRSRMGAA